MSLIITFTGLCVCEKEAGGGGGGGEHAASSHSATLSFTEVLVVAVSVTAFPSEYRV